MCLCWLQIPIPATTKCNIKKRNGDAEGSDPNKYCIDIGNVWFPKTSVLLLSVVLVWKMRQLLEWHHASQCGWNDSVS